MVVKIEKIKELPITKLKPLIEDSQKEGISFVQKLVNEWVTKTNCFNLKGEVFLIAKDSKVVGLCGLNIDPYYPVSGLGRVRHLYILSSRRRQGIGTLLIQNIIEQARQNFDLLNLRTNNPQADRFYLARGFQRSYIVFVSQENIPDIMPGKTSLGIDAGISSFIATSDGTLIQTPQFVQKAASKLRSLQRRLKHKIKGSNNWLKLQKLIAKLHFVVISRRTDWLFKLAHQLCDRANNIFVENIDFRTWQKGLFGKQINNSAIGKFINEILPFVCFKRGVYYSKVDKNYTSQICPECGANTGKKTLSQRVHRCKCGAVLNRDIASAKVVQQRGKIAVGHTANKNACGGEVTGVVQLNLFDLVNCC